MLEAPGAWGSWEAVVGVDMDSVGAGLSAQSSARASPRGLDSALGCRGESPIEISLHLQVSCHVLRKDGSLGTFLDLTRPSGFGYAASRLARAAQCGSWIGAIEMRAKPLFSGVCPSWWFSRVRGPFTEGRDPRASRNRWGSVAVVLAITLGGLSVAQAQPNPSASAPIGPPVPAVEASTVARPGASAPIVAPSGTIVGQVGIAAPRVQAPGASDVKPLASGAVGGRPATSPSGSAAALSTVGEVRIHDRPILTILVPQDGRPALERAREANAALDKVAAARAKGEEVLVRRSGELAIVLVGTTPIVHLGPEDAEAQGSPSLDALASNVASNLRNALDAESQRTRTLHIVFALSLVVVLGLFGLFLLRKVGDFWVRARTWLDENPERVPALRVRSIEVVNARVLRGTVLIGLACGKWIAQIGIGYAWLLFSLSRFEATKGYTERLTGFVLTPLATLLDRLITAIPLLVVGAAAVLALLVLLRFLSLYFASVERGETQAVWLPRDLAAPTSLLVRAGVVVAALVFLGPLVTGQSEGPISLLGVLCVGTVGLASTPFLASATVGAIQLFTRRLPLGTVVELGGRTGKVKEVNLFEVKLIDARGAEVRVPHLFTLFRPTRLLGTTRRVSVRLTVGNSSPREQIIAVLSNAASNVGERPDVEILSADHKSTRFRVSVGTDAQGARSALWIVLLTALGQSKIVIASSHDSVAPR